VSVFLVDYILGVAPDFYGGLIRHSRCQAAVVSAVFRVPSASQVQLEGTKTAEIVPGKQHPPTTSFETVQTPKKAADA
jgi:hypothetical protein